MTERLRPGRFCHRRCGGFVGERADERRRREIRRGGSRAAGAGKSWLVSTAAGAARDASGSNAAIVVATPTNDQAYGLVDTISSMYPARTVAFMPAKGRALPPSTAARSNVAVIDAQDARNYPVVVGTLDKLGDAASRGYLPTFDYLCVDEAFQGDAGKYYMVGDISNRHLLVGDPGQLDPFTTMHDPGRWRGLAEDPTQTAVQVLTRNHTGTEQHLMPITRRLPASAIPVVQAFYPGHRFRAWTLPDARRLTLIPGPAREGPPAMMQPWTWRRQVGGLGSVCLRLLC